MSEDFLVAFAVFVFIAILFAIYQIFNLSERVAALEEHARMQRKILRFIWDFVSPEKKEEKRE